MTLVGNAFVNVFSTPSSMARLRMLKPVAAEHHARWPGDVRAMIVIAEGVAVQRMSEEARAESAAMTRDYPARATSLVIHGTGFGAAATRAMIAGFYFVARTGIGRTAPPHRVDADVATGAEWLLRATASSPCRLTIEELVHGVEEGWRTLGLRPTPDAR